MIFSLSGTIKHIDETFIVIDSNGVGYQVFVTDSVRAMAVLGEPMDLYIYDVVRETSRDLYGFITLLERNIYVKLLGVSGIGPKTGLAILNSTTIEDLVRAISQEDVSVLHSVSGIGRKTASKIILELKNKIDISILPETEANKDMVLKSEVIDALVALGYSAEQARRAVASISLDEYRDQSAFLREALRNLSRFSN